MLQSLYISNYALIDEITLDFRKGLTVITGETGAGKSILLGALSLILGKRAESGVLYNDSKKCIAEATFQLERTVELKEFFDLHDLEFDAECIVRREIAPSGKSRAFVNDTPVNLTILKALTRQLVDLHQQNETLELMRDSFQIQLVDALADNSALLEEYTGIYTERTVVQKKLDDLRHQQAEAKKTQDYNQFLYDELESLNLAEASEQESLEHELNLLENAATIKENLSAVVLNLSEQDYNVASLLQSATESLEAVSKFDPQLLVIQKRLESASLEIEDASSEIARIEANIETDEGRLSLVNDRLNDIYRLQKKHQVLSVSELMSIQQSLESELVLLTNSEEAITTLEQEVQSLDNNCKKIAKKLSERRKAQQPIIANKVKELLAFVGMPNARLTVGIAPLESLQPTGLDAVQFLFAANSGSNPAPLKKMASGGELSRLMLVLKSLVAGSMSFPTLIFDEIDTGISGEVAQKVGIVMERMSSNHQLICITHLPQIAAKGSNHLFVHKEVKAGRTYSRVKLLNNDERVTEIAKMLSGAQPGEAAIANAQELIAATA